MDKTQPPVFPFDARYKSEHAQGAKHTEIRENSRRPVNGDGLYIAGQFVNDAEREKVLEKLDILFGPIQDTWNQRHRRPVALVWNERKDERLFLLSVPRGLYNAITTGLTASGFSSGGCYTPTILGLKREYEVALPYDGADKLFSAFIIDNGKAFASAGKARRFEQNEDKVREFHRHVVAAMDGRLSIESAFELLAARDDKAAIGRNDLAGTNRQAARLNPTA